MTPFLAGKHVPAVLPLPDGWREVEEHDGGVAVYVNDATGESTIERCANARCQCPFVAKNARQRTCGKRRCLWVIREENPTRIKSKKDRFDRWYKDPEHRESHVKVTLAARKRRKIAAQILDLLASRGGAVPVLACFAIGPVEIVSEALAALWYTDRIIADGGQIRAMVRVEPRYLRLPPATTAVPQCLHVSAAARIVFLLAGSPRGRTVPELAEDLGSDEDAAVDALRPLRGLLRRFRRVRSGQRAYRLAEVVLGPRKGKGRHLIGNGLVTPSTRGGRAEEPATTLAAAAQHVADPWSLPSPSYGSHLPGAGLILHLIPTQARLELSKARAIHGLLTKLLDEPHDPRAAAWSLLPWDDGCGWAVYLRREEHVRRLALRHHGGGMIFDRPVLARFSQPIRLRAPAPRAPGRHLLRIDAVTPVCIRSNGRGSRTVHLSPTSESILSALTQAFPARLGLEGFDPGTAVLRIVSKSTQPERVFCGEHLGSIRGWTGSVIVEANAIAAWLLECAGRIGLGGRVALGFGRVRVSPVIEPRPVTWTLVDAAVHDYVRAMGASKSQARRAMLLDLRHARPVGRADDRPRSYEGPTPTNAVYLVRELDEERVVVGVTINRHN